jgi:Ca2+-dependent lipid-binding protein
MCVSREQQYETAVAKEGGKNPVWNEEFTFEVTVEKEISIEVMDKDENGMDKFMGGATVSIVDWIGLGKWEGDVELQDKGGKPVGGVTLTVTFQRPGELAHALVQQRGDACLLLRYSRGHTRCLW